MPSYGYIVYQFQVHRHGRAREPLRLDTLEDPNEPGEAGTDALPIFYGLMNGLRNIELTDTRHNHLTVNTVTGSGRCIKFAADIGRSGQESRIVDRDDESVPAFERTKRHIEEVPSRGMLVVPGRAVKGFLILEAHGRRTGRELLQGELKRLVRTTTSDRLITDFDSAVDEQALAAYLREAQVNSIALRRNKLPDDLADVMEIAPDERKFGKLNMQVQGRFNRDILRKLRENTEARRRMLTIQGLDFDELNVKVQVGDQRATVSVTGDRTPTFINVIDTETRPTDIRFYREVEGELPNIARAYGVQLGIHWANRRWSKKQLAYIIERPHPGGPDDESPSEGA